MPRLVHRPARVIPPPPVRTTFSVPEPPANDEPTKPPLMQMLIPALSSVGILFFGVAAHNLGLLLVGGLAMVGSLAAPIVMARTSRRQHAQRVTRRRTRYQLAIASLGQVVEQSRAEARAALEAVHPLPLDLERFAAGSRLWERRLDDDDFLDVAVGVGEPPSGFTVEHNRDRVYLDAVPDADLVQAATALAERAAVLSDAPVVLSLREDPVVAVCGERGAALGLVRAVVGELSVCCGPDELHLMVLSPPDSARDWDWAKWLPHSTNSAGSSGARRPEPLIATSEAAISRLLSEIVGPRLRLLQADDRHTPATVLPRLVLVVDQFDPATALQEFTLLWEALRHASEMSVTVLAVCPTPDDRPEETTAFVDLPPGATARLHHPRSGRSAAEFRPHRLSEVQADRVARSLAPARLVGEAAALSRVDSDRLFDLLGIDTLPQAAPAWPRRAEQDLLRVPVGTLPDGKHFELDLKESAAGGHGPHGLVVGATGSGKSELLRGVVTALMLRHPPEDLALVFADFKGGATFDLLADAPQCAGFITNLEDDLSLVDRMKAAITGEQARRQELLRAAGRDVQKIAQYRQMRTGNPGLPPLPYLVIVIDEFGELLEARPDFLDVFLTIGRTGRSLGMHMMLASQRLDAGRIRGLETYLSYRLTLRTFTAEESTAAIGNKLAYELPALPGQGYFRAAEVFTRFKAARVTLAPAGQDADDVPLVAAFGADPPGPGRGPAQAPAADSTDLARAVGWLRRSPAWVDPLWLDPLPSPTGAQPLVITSPVLTDPAATEAVAGLPVPIGLVDLPERRAQPPFAYNAAALDGHLSVVGSPRSGKSSCLRAIATGALVRYSPREVQFYGVDLTSGGLGALAGLPNVGSVALASEPDRIRRVFAELVSLLDERARRFRELGVESMADWLDRVRAGAPGAERGHVVLLLDGYLALRQRLDDVEALLVRLLVDGPSFGVHVVLATNRWADFRPAHLESVSTRVELRLNDPSDSQISRHAAASVPRSMPGRGLLAGGVPVQLANPAHTTEGLAGLVTRLRAHAARHWPGASAPRLMMLSDLDTETWDGFLRDAAADGQACVGVAEQGPEAVTWNPGAGQHLHVIGDPGNGRTALLARLAGELSAGRGAAQLFVVDYRGDLTRSLRRAGVPFTGAHTPAQLAALLPVLDKELALRQEAAAAHIAGGDGDWEPAAQPLALLVDDFELVHAGKMNPFVTVAPMLAYGRDLAFGVALVQAARGVGSRTTDLLVKGLVDQEAAHLFFSIGNADDLMTFRLKGRVLPPAVASLRRPRRADTLVMTNRAGR